MTQPRLARAPLEIWKWNRFLKIKVTKTTATSYNSHNSPNLSSLLKKKLCRNVYEHDLFKYKIINNILINIA